MCHSSRDSSKSLFSTVSMIMSNFEFLSSLLSAFLIAVS
uniref:Uncharacterized protein n=1 Tax=Arundo donax TaxID=35708 RepID=A0A0A9G2I8_ARUDO